ncbi:hypothetical protein GQ43DRAFT_446489 [Delitschia confertaspora ATCC 74209]|uniref:Protein kinase domain-containing protein n=1 Tax=Delitschia confertaspora ATCC 74209 TaxID=1513339 RepID=A0A9P4JUZ6_9PLEO|nr:hypothetical protein GQ43DRAFT_446489 [Delitschia confertaspora ATCC 74209]
MVQYSILFTLMAVDYLHQCGCSHFPPNNLFQCILSNEILSLVEQHEVERPSAGKILQKDARPNRTLYASRCPPHSKGLPVLCDFGEARIGPWHRRNIMSDAYRALEVILGMVWDLRSRLLKSHNLFPVKKYQIVEDERHLAEMVSLLGVPPTGFLKRSGKCKQYCDERGSVHE